MRWSQFFFTFIGIGLMVSVSVSSAQWSTDPSINTPVCIAAENQWQVCLASDGTYGAFIAWTDCRNGTANSDIYVQRLNDMGVAQWGANGVSVCAAPANQYLRAMISDGVGGAIIVWVDYRNGTPNCCDIYAQRVNASGVMLWMLDGVPVSTGANNKAVGAIVSDGDGGAIIPFCIRFGSFDDIYAQRIDANGQTVWAVEVPICVALRSQYLFGAVSDNDGGAILMWIDDRDYPQPANMYARRVSAGGVALWTVDGVPVCSYTSEKRYPRMTADATGGAIITWEDVRSITGPEIYAQRIDASGTLQWVTDGVAVCAGKNSSYPVITSDSHGGAIIAWQDARSGSTYDIYAQRIAASGAPLWNLNGRLIGYAASYMIMPPSDRINIASDPVGGAIVAWHDYRGTTSRDVLAQRVSANGDTLWGNGVAVCTAPNEQIAQRVLCDSVGDATITWVDYRTGVNSDIYAQYVDPFGNLAKLAPNERVGLLILDVQHLVESDKLSNGEGNALESKLRNAKKNLETGHSTPAVNQLHAFTNQVQAFTNSRRLALEDGQPLITKGKRIAAQVGGLFKEPKPDQRSGQLRPSTFALAQNYPNPFNPLTIIRYQLPIDSWVTLKVYDLLGRELAMLVDGMEEAGYKSVQFDGSRLSSGVYFYRLQAGDLVATKKMLIVK